MSVHSSQKKETKVDYLNTIQSFLTEVYQYIKTEELDECDYLIFKQLLEEIIKGFVLASRGNYIKIVDIATYHKRLDLFIETKAIFKSLTEYLEIVWASHSLSEKRYLRWCTLLGDVNSKIKKNNISDLNIIKRLLGKQLKNSDITKLILKFESKVYSEEVLP